MLNQPSTECSFTLPLTLISRRNDFETIAREVQTAQTPINTTETHAQQRQVRQSAALLSQ